MKLRRTAWLLTLLLSAFACFGTPGAGIPITRVSYSVVYPDKFGKPSVPKQQVSEPRESVRPHSSESLQILSKDRTRAFTALLDPVRFQRPPPRL